MLTQDTKATYWKATERRQLRVCSFVRSGDSLERLLRQRADCRRRRCLDRLWVCRNVQLLRRHIWMTPPGSGGPSGCATGAPTIYGVVSGTCAGYAKPSWQSGIIGNPNDGVRDVPDVSLFAANGIWGTTTCVCYSDPAYGGLSCNGTPDTWAGCWGNVGCLAHHGGHPGAGQSELRAAGGATRILPIMPWLRRNLAPAVLLLATPLWAMRFPAIASSTT